LNAALDVWSYIWLEHRLSREYLIQDPHHEYAARFIEQLYRKYGYRAVCFYTNRRERLRCEPRFPILRSEYVAAAYDMDLSDLAGFAAHIATRHRVAAVLPFNEPAVAPAAELARHLGLSWAQPQVMRRFHDKFAFKEYLRSESPNIRMNASLRVESVADVLLARRDPAFRRFVLKPNDGFGNRSIGLFDAATAEADIDDFLRRLPNSPMLMEQYVDGLEYFVNGQVDGQGEVVVVAIFQYLRRPANGRHNIDFETLLVPHRDPRFAQLARYAEQVVQASGLRRSPFHVELMVDDAGPCLIEAGARLAGHGNAFLSGEVHGPRLDLIDVAAHYYLEPADYGPLPLDWAAHDASAVRYVHGVATRRERICQLEGIREIEALPEFYGWVRKPVIGEQLEPTVDSLSMPFSLILKAPTQDALSEAAAQVRRTLRWNRSVGLGRRFVVGMGCQLRRCTTAARVRVLSRFGREHGMIVPITGRNSFGSLNQRMRGKFGNVLDALSSRVQLLEIGRRGVTRPAGQQTPKERALADAVLRWAREYLTRPHPKLGRPGPICPVVHHTIELGRFMVNSYDEVDGANVRRLRRIVLDEARGFLEHSPWDASKNAFASLVLVFPKLPDANLAVLDRVHDRLKTHLIAKRDLMFSPFHKRSTKPSISNPDFAVFRAPFPMLVIRHMDVRDIVFLDHNPRAFRRYRARFGSQYERGEMSDEFGYVRRYVEACRRFGMRGPDIAAVQA
jgi:hypothetical protein